MTQVTNQTELQAALRAQEPLIQLIQDFAISSQITITYEVTLESPSSDTIFTLSKSASYFSFMFRVTGGSLHLCNIILDGARTSHSEEDIANRSLVYVTGGSLYLEDGSHIQNNHSYQEGGGIYLKSDTDSAVSLVVSGNVSITGCSSRTSGGGIMLAVNNALDSFILGGQLLVESNIAANGGGIYYRTYTQGIGGSLAVTDNALITNNSADAAGGGINFSGYRNGNSPYASLILSGSAVISGNTAGNGGGIYYYAANAGDQLRLLANASVVNNTAAQSGGGIFITSPTGSIDASLTDVRLSENTAGTGGGIYLLSDSGGSLILRNVSVMDNKAVNGASGSGGGIWMQNRSSSLPVLLHLNNSWIERNQASSNGGGLAIYGGPGEFSFLGIDTSISENTAIMQGGGIQMGNSGSASIDFTTVTIANNSTQGPGGGLYYSNTSAAASQTITMQSLEISGNTAGTEGGGLRLSSGNAALIATLTDCTVTSNTARTSSGGGIWGGGTQDTLVLNGTTQVISNISEEGNGGGIYFNSDNGAVLLNDNCTINGNHADVRPSKTGNHGGGICLVPGSLTVNDSAEISGNSALKYGGGISAAQQSVISLQGGSVHSNVSSVYGGGIWIHDESTFTMSGGSVYNNEAGYGGGIYNSQDSRILLIQGSILGNHASIGGGIYNEAASVVTLTSDIIFGEGTQNTVSSYGPGIYNEGILYMEGDREVSNGVYIENREAVVRITQALTADSIIQLDNTPYVSPNNEGNPIVVAEAVPDYPVLNQTDSDAFRKPAAGFENWHIILSNDLTQVLLVPIQYTITYENLMGAANSNPESYTAISPDILLSHPGNIPGYRFIGWYDAPSGGSPVTLIPSGSTGDIILYARWEISGRYLVVYDDNTHCCPSPCCVPPPVFVSPGDSLVISRQKPVRRHYRFAGWNTSPDGLGTTYLPGTVIQDINTSYLLYAIWEKCCPCI